MFIPDKMKRSSFIKSLIGIPFLVNALGEEKPNPSHGGLYEQMEKNTNHFSYNPHLYLRDPTRILTIINPY